MGQSKIAVPAIRERQNYGLLASGPQPPGRAAGNYNEARRDGDFTLATITASIAGTAILLWRR